MYNHHWQAMFVVHCFAYRKSGRTITVARSPGRTLLAPKGITLGNEWYYWTQAALPPPPPGGVLVQPFVHACSLHAANTARLAALQLQQSSLPSKRPPVAPVWQDIDAVLVAQHLLSKLMKQPCVTNTTV